MGAHFASVNIQNQNMGKPAVTRIINRHITQLKTKIQTDETESKQLVEFSDINTSLNPTFDEDNHYFCNPELLITILKELKYNTLTL